MSNVHDSKKNYTCEKCGKEFFQKSTLVDHNNSHEGIRNFKCGQCPKKFMRKFYLKTHVEAVHSKKIDAGVKKFKCEHCSKSFNRKFSLTLYKTVQHSDEKILECNESGKVYDLESLMITSRSNSTESLNRYEEPAVKKEKSSSINSYQNLKDFKCDTCDQTLR